MTQVKMVSLNFLISKSCRLLGILYFQIEFNYVVILIKRYKLFKDNIVFIELVN